MSNRTAILAMGLAVLFGCADQGPTELALLGPEEVSLSQAATGATLGTSEDMDLAASDYNEDGVVCVKTVPGGKGKAAPRTIVKDNKDDGTCPGGFEAWELTIGDLPVCTASGQSTDECDCEAAGGLDFDGQCFFAG
jgi:hypothetical protein